MMLPKQAEELADRVKQEELTLAKQLFRIMQQLDDVSQQLEDTNEKNKATQQVHLSLSRGSRS